MVLLPTSFVSVEVLKLGSGVLVAVTLTLARVDVLVVVSAVVVALAVTRLMILYTIR